MNSFPPEELRRAAARGRALVEESREAVVVLDEEERLLAASRRAREVFPALEEGAPLPQSLRAGESAAAVPYVVDGVRETLVYLGTPGQLAAYEELRAGFTAAVSHELRTPLARLLAMLETAELPGADVRDVVDAARAEIEQIRELIDDVLFLGELETGREVVSLGSTPVEPVVAEVVERLGERAARAGVELRTQIEQGLELPVRPRMLRVVVENLAENALRYAGADTTLTLSARRGNGHAVLAATDSGAGVADDDLPRLFERFYRADRARASRGTGLGLAIVKHVTTAAGGTVEAAHAPGGGLEIRCVFVDR